MRRIQRRLLTEGRNVGPEQITKALQRAVKAGMIAEVVENRYKAMRPKGRAPKAGTSGSKRVLQRPSHLVVKQKLAVRKPMAGASAPKRLAGSSKLVRGASSSASGPKSPVQSRPKLVAAKQPRAGGPSSSAEKRLGARGRLAAKPKLMYGRRNATAVKSRVKLLARALATAAAKARRLKALPTKGRGAQLKTQRAAQKGRVARRGRRPKNAAENDSDNSSNATGDDNGMGRIGRGGGDDHGGEGADGNDHEMADAGCSEDDLVRERGREGANSVSLPNSNGYEVVSIFPGWAK
nr:hypothetical protein BaRGS_020462 [Batillaria attramentaria]